MKKTVFEEMDGTYIRHGDYLIPCLTLPEEEEQRLIGACGQRHKRFERIVEQMKQAQGTTEQLKVENQMEWTARMNNIQACTREIVNAELLYI